MKCKYFIVETKICVDIPKQFKEKFPQLKGVSLKEISEKIILDELGDLSKFETKYYNDYDIKEIFKK